MTRSNVYTSPYPMPQVPTNQSVSQFLTQTNPDDVHPDKPVWADYHRSQAPLSYRRIRETAAQDAAILKRDLNVKEGDVVCIYAPNSVDWALLAHAVMWLGGCFCGINAQATSFELVHYLSVAKPKILAVDSSLLSNVTDALSSLTEKPTVLHLGDSSVRSDGAFHYPIDFVGKRSSAASLEPLDLTSRDNRSIPCGMCFSSGTSGKPKAVVFTHYNLLAQLLALRSTDPPNNCSAVREVFFPPFGHIYGIVSGVLMPAWVGSYMQVMPGFDYSGYFRRCAEIRATILRLVPTVAVRMVKDTAIQGLDLSSVTSVVCSGAPLSDDTAEALRSLVSLEGGVQNGYGMSESSITYLRGGRPDKRASVGRPFAGVSIRVVDDNLKDVEPGQPGECLVKGPTVFHEYKDNPTETRQTKINGWLHTGDMLKVDEEGFFVFTGRKKELIKYKGNQIAPAELDAILLLHPQVAEAGVCGVYDKEQESEIPVAFVTLRPDVSVTQRDETLEEIREFVNSRVSTYKRLREKMVHLDELPKNSTGKLMRRSLAAKAAELRNRKLKL